MRYKVAKELRPNGGFEIYFYGLDTDFCDRIDSDFVELYHTLNRPMLKQNPVTLMNG